MDDRILECVANFSEGQNLDIIEKIGASISAIHGVKVLNIDHGESANRTVITFAGEPNAVVEAAYQAIKFASELIDMTKQKGSHPRIGATDVCPLIPISGITMEETILLSKQLGQRVGDTLGIPVFLYEHSTRQDYRKNLAVIRKGEYEGMAMKMKDLKWRPDFGPSVFNPKTGATVIGARNFLIAYNINLDTKDVGLAKLISAELREKSGSFNYKGKKYTFFGGLKNVKAIGWIVDEFDICQVSCNLTDFNTSGVHLVYEKVKTLAAKYDVDVKGSELIGMIPEKALLDAGKFYASDDKNENVFLEVAVEKLGLNSVKPFSIKNNIIESRLL